MSVGYTAKIKTMNLRSVGFEIHKMMTMKPTVLSEVTLCSLVDLSVFQSYGLEFMSYKFRISKEAPAVLPVVYSVFPQSSYTNAWIMPRLFCDRFVSNLF